MIVTKKEHTVSIGAPAYVVSVAVQDICIANDIGSQSRHDIQLAIFDIGIIRGGSGHFEFTVTGEQDVRFRDAG